jgi:murein DD-endopeptidase MepM/ murein hydrolase activator NlpD
MAEYTTKYSPMHIDCTIGQPYGNVDPNYSCGFHTGVDFPQSGVAVQNPDLYSITDDGVVVYVYNQSQGTTPALGNQVQIYDNRTGLYYRYCHMLYGSVTLNVGDRVNLNTIVGKMGNTGNSTGTHLHLEASTSQVWSCSNFVDPCQPLGFPNTRGTIVKWDSTPPTPPIPTVIKKKKFPWVIYFRKLRNRRNLTNL